MPAPKGNKFAAKVHKKAAPFGVRLSSEAQQALENMIIEQHTTKSQLIENLILREYLRQNKKKLEN